MLLQSKTSDDGVNKTQCKNVAEVEKGNKLKTQNSLLNKGKFTIKMIFWTTIELPFSAFVIIKFKRRKEKRDLNLFFSTQNSFMLTQEENSLSSKMMYFKCLWEFN